MAPDAAVPALPRAARQRALNPAYARGFARNLAVGAGAFAIALAYACIKGVNLQDESWFLQVVNRVLSGDVLYRDVAFGATPLSVYASTALASVFGIEVLVVKAVVSICFAISVLACWSIARRLEFGPRRTVACIAALLLYLLPGISAFGAAYTPMAIASMLVCFACVLAASDGNRRALVLGAVAAAVCFASKQNMGVYALAAFLIVLVGRGRIRSAVQVTGVFAVTTVVLLLPVILNGGLAWLVDYGFTGKGTYMRLGHVSYAWQVAGILTTLGDIRSLRVFYWEHQFLLPILTLAVLAFAVVARGQRDAQTMVVVLFAGAGLASVFPRAEWLHLTVANPFLIIATAHLWPTLRAAMTRRAASLWVWLAGVWLGAGLVALVCAAALQTKNPQQVWSTLPHFRGVMIERAALVDLEREVGSLRDNATEGALFIVGPKAGFYYVLTGLRNPTAFDYPFATTFGKAGEERTARAIREGTIKAACIDPAMPPRFRPLLVETAIRQTMKPERVAGSCHAFRL
jgi:hypothetical protein